MEKNEKIFGFDKNIFFMSTVSFFTDVSSEMIYPLLPIFLTSVLGVGTAFVGLVEGVAESTSSLLKLFSGWFSDRLKKRKALVCFGYTLSSLTRPLVAVATAGWHVLLVRFTDRIGKGIRTSPRDALIADSCDIGERGKAFGFNRAMDHAGAVAGPLIAFALLAFVTNNYRTVFWLAFIPALFAVFIVLFAVKEKNKSGEGETTPVKISLKPFDKKFRSFLLIILLFALGNSSDAFLILRAKSLGVATALIPILWMVLHIVKMLSSMPGGMLSDKLGRKGTITAGWLIYSLVYFGFAFAGSQYQAWILFAIYGLFFGLTEGAEKAFVCDLVSANIRGSAYGVYNFMIGVSALPSSLIMGILWQRYGVETAFSFGAFLALTASILLFFLLKKDHKK